MSAMRHEFRPDVEGLRGVAVVAVLAYHFDVTLLPGGFLGVDIFFVISGFVITRWLLSEMEDGGFSFARFYVRRANRLLPALYATVALALLGGFLLFGTTHFDDLARSAVASVLGVPNVYFWRTSGYFANDAIFQPLLHLWSIGVEFQFYLVWPAFLLLVRRRSPLFWIILLAGLSLIAAELFNQRGLIAFYNTPFRIFEFTIGAAIPLLPRGRAASSSAIWALGLGITIASFFLLNERMPLPGLYSLLPCLGTGIAIFAGASPLGARVLGHPLPRHLGRISYSLYLVHWPVVVFYSFLHFDALAPTDWMIVAGVSLALAELLHYGIENPLRSTSLASLISVRRHGLAALSIAAVAGMVIGLGGMPQRLEAAAAVVVATGQADCGYPRCIYPASATAVDLIVVGDSHARHLYRGLARLAEERNLSFAVFHFDQGCRPTNAINRERDYDCNERLGEFYDFVDAHAPSHLLLAARWMNFDPADLRQQFGKVLVRPQMRSIRTVAVMLNVPEAYENLGPQVCLVPGFITDPDDRCSSHLRSDPFYQEREERNRQIEEQFEDVLVMDPFDVLCTETTCHQQIEGKWAYSDKHHLSAYGSKLLVEHYRDELERWLDE